MAPSRTTSKRARVVDSSSSSEDEPIAPKRTRTARTAAAAAPAAAASSAADAPAPPKPTRKRAKKVAAASDSEDEPPAAVPPPAKRGRKAASAVKDEPASSSATSSSSSSAAAAPKRRGRPPSASSSPASSPAPTTARGKGKAKAKTPAAAVKKEEEAAANGDGDSDGGSGSDDDGDGEFKWWKQENPLGDGRTKWTTLSHNGVYFPPAYVPHGVQMKYNGKPIKLGPAAEEVATFFAGVVGTTWAENPIFVSNFFEDWMDVIKRTEPATCPIKEFGKCDFTPLLALRAGNEKGEDEADTVGCCSLRYEHVTLKEGNKVVFDFLGKDSIRDGDDLFDRITTTSLNKHLTSLMPGLTAKVFRTYNASITFQQELENTPADGSVADKELAYNRANRQVAVLCNHQRAVPPTHDAQLGKLKDKIRALKYQRREAKKLMLQLDPKLKKSRKDLTEPESDLDDEWIAEYLESEKVKDKEKLQKKLDKDNAEREAKGESLLTLKDLEDAAAKRAARDPTLEQLEKKVAKLGDQIHAAKTQLVDKDENKTTALSTSKINYIDPRITAAWCRKHDVPIEKMFPRTLREKFKWAMDVEANWEF
ncbi:hypothetical protein AMAG_16954 [Allomyces macrogynus ATCC 38327]|uniref:DNA topoisomerase 1 n=1 Tax=Allomyces macrogynus (strain ATCC 38327) TaxID=578462 RepID=A0A0L0TE33_ALLM3|nr:hypothetical protein AMAG_16954 [Allomyces macrogynus ATCC 38327]|eukprot:KNE72849.1 hypothetical protein AMAG_16954 [Allomyces macrogynus ATCC 38327]